MYNKQDSELNDIIEGFQMLGSDTGGLVNPNELKEIMDIMNMSEKNPFIYNIILTLCSDQETQQKGGIEASDFISLLDQELNDTSSIEGLLKIFTVFSNPSTNTIPLSTFSQIVSGERDQDEETIKKLVSKPEINGKEIDFNEFHDIVKTETPKQSLHEHIIYKKKQSSSNKKFKDENSDNQATENNVNSIEINFSNNLINNNSNFNSNFNSINPRDSIESDDKNSERYSYGNKKSPNIKDENSNEVNSKYSCKKPRPEKSVTNENNTNNKINNKMNNKIDVINNNDINSFDNVGNNFTKKNINEEEVISIKKKYRHKRKSPNKDDIDIDNANENPKNEKEKKDHENNNNKASIDKDNIIEGKNPGKFLYEINKKETNENKNNKEDQKENNYISRNSRKHTRGRVEQKNNIDIEINEIIDNEEKSDVKTERRYHRIYRDVKSTTPDKTEDNNNNNLIKDNNNNGINSNKNSIGYSRYRRKK